MQSGRASMLLYMRGPRRVALVRGGLFTALVRSHHDPYLSGSFGSVPRPAWEFLKHTGLDAGRR